MKRIVLLATIAVLTTVPPAGAQVVSRIAAIVNDEIITTGQLDREMDRLSAENTGRESLSDEKRLELKKELLSSLINDVLVDQRAKKLGIEITEEDVDKAIADVQRQNGIDREQLKAALEAEGMTYSEYRTKLARQLLNFKLVGREIRNEVEVTNQELRNYFQEHIDEYREAPFIRLSRISFFLPPSSDANQAAALRSFCQEARQELRRGTPFAEVLEKFRKDKGGDGGAMGTFGEGELTEPFAEAVQNLAVGQVSEVIQTPEGYHVLYLEEKNPGRIPSFEEVRDQLSKLILERKRQEALEGWAENLKKEAHIEIKL
jgi:peptidyl-prolyl cis-trans isomerase SurA